MYRRHYNLVLMGFWLFVAAALFAPELVLPDRVREQVGGSTGVLGGALAVVFAAYNLVRWAAYQTLRRNRDARRVNPLAVRRQDEDERYEPNPELDFLKPPGADEQAHP